MNRNELIRKTYDIYVQHNRAIVLYRDDLYLYLKGLGVKVTRKTSKEELIQEFLKRLTPDTLEEISSHITMELFKGDLLELFGISRYKLDKVIEKLGIAHRERRFESYGKPKQVASLYSIASIISINDALQVS